MALANLQTPDFDRNMSLSEKACREDAQRCNDAFTRAMAAQISKGREKVKPGTFIDPTPSYAMILRGEVSMSPCGSPAAMCMESGSDTGGAETLK